MPLPWRDLFDTFTEAKLLVGRWRRETHCFRAHSALGHRPPALEAIEILPPVSASLQPEAPFGLEYGFA